MKTYMKIIAWIVGAVALFGFIGPFLVSDDSYELPALFALIVVIVGGIVVKKVIQLIEENSNEDAE